MAGQLGSPISTAPAVEPAMMDRRTLGFFLAGASSFAVVEAIADVMMDGCRGRRCCVCRVRPAVVVEIDVEAVMMLRDGLGGCPKK